MASLTTNNSSIGRQVTKMSSFVLQNTSQQDVALFGSTDNFDFIIASDGHGIGPCKHALRDLFNTLDWSSILQNENWYKNDINEEGNYISPLFATLHSNTDAFSKSISTRQGCTLSVVLIYADYFECFTIGDSTIKIWEKSEGGEWSRTFVSVDHDLNFTEDVAHLEVRKRSDALFCRRNWERNSIMVQNGIHKSKVFRLKAIDENKITMEQSAYFDFDDDSRLNMTRSLGHYPTSFIVQRAAEVGHALSYCEHSLTRVRIDRKPDLNYVLFAATDGVWDVVAESIEKGFIDLIAEDVSAAEKIACRIKELWSQSWHYIWEGVDSGMTTLPDWNHDDIGVAVAFC